MPEVASQNLNKGEEESGGGGEGPGRGERGTGEENGHLCCDEGPVA
jgi:hypothetical protein